MIKQKLLLAVIFTITLTSVVVHSQVNKFDENGNRHGVWKKNYPNTDQVRYQGKFNHGKEIDTFKYYKLKRKKSVLSAVKVFNAKDNSADVTFMTSNGNVISKGNMNGKKFIGQWLFFHKNSDVVMIEENYNQNGQLEGNRKVFFINGVLAEEAEYKNGMKNGVLKIYSESNKVLQESFYKNDKLDGKTRYFDLDSNLEAVGSFKANLKTGIWEYFKNGKLVRKVDHDNNKVLFKKQ